MIGRKGRSLSPAAQQLYELVLSPLEARLTCARLLVIPSGALHATPFHALWDGSRHLVERFEVARFGVARFGALRVVVSAGSLVGLTASVRLVMLKA